MDLPNPLMPQDPESPADQLDRLHGKVGDLAESLLDTRAPEGAEIEERMFAAKMRLMGANLGLQLLKQSNYSASSKNPNVKALTNKIPDRAALEKLMELTPPD